MTVSATTLTTPSIFNNDLLGTETPTSKTVVLKVIRGSKDAENNFLLSINLKGQLTVPAHTPAGTYYLHYQLCLLKGNAPCATATATVVLLSEVTTPPVIAPESAQPSLVVYNGLFAQSIGINDHLHIKNIELYSQHSVCIFNRNGQKVFESSSYNNITNVFRANSQTESIYFYLIQYLDAKNQPHSLSGYLYIKK